MATHKEDQNNRTSFADPLISTDVKFAEDLAIQTIESARNGNGNGNGRFKSPNLASRLRPDATATKSRTGSQAMPVIESQSSEGKDLSPDELSSKRYLLSKLMGYNKSELTEDTTTFSALFDKPVTIGDQEFKSRDEVAKGIDRFSNIADIARGKSRSSGEYNLDFGGVPIKDFSPNAPSGSWNKLSFKPAKIDKNIVLNGSFEQAFKIVLASEGGFANHKSDKGGPTMYGIASKSNPKEYQMIMDQLARGDKDGAMQTTMNVYKTKYWDLVPGIEKMSPSARLVAFDASINHGVGFASKMVKATNADADAMIDYRAEKYASIIRRDPSQADFKNGWADRLAKLDAITDASERNKAVDSVLASVSKEKWKSEPLAPAPASSKANYRNPAPEPA